MASQKTKQLRKSCIHNRACHRISARHIDAANLCHQPFGLIRKPKDLPQFPEGWAVWPSVTFSDLPVIRQRAYYARHAAVGLSPKAATKYICDICHLPVPVDYCLNFSTCHIIVHSFIYSTWVSCLLNQWYQPRNKPIRSPKTLCWANFGRQCTRWWQPFRLN